MPISTPFPPSNLTKLEIAFPQFQQPRFGPMPAGLISLVLDSSDSQCDDLYYAFETLDLSGLPSSLRELKILSRKGFRLIGELPSELQRLMTSKDVIVECHVPAGVKHDAGRDHVDESLKMLSELVALSRMASNIYFILTLNLMDFG
jgi:hypothetical protein